MLIKERKSTRHSTAIKSAETARRVRERALERRRGRRSGADTDYKPTQEELLEEAKLTELENLKSLGDNLLIVLIRFRKTFKRIEI